jgi:hypothetical protein
MNTPADSTILTEKCRLAANENFGIVAKMSAAQNKANA